MTEIFDSMLIGDVIDAHGARWFRIQFLCTDLAQGRRLYLAAKIDDPLPAATHVIAEEIEAAELESLRATEAKHQAELAAFKHWKRHKP